MFKFGSRLWYYSSLLFGFIINCIFLAPAFIETVLAIIIMIGAFEFYKLIMRWRNG